MLPCLSEPEPKRELHLAAGVPCARYNAELRRPDLETRVAEGRVVQQIEELAAQLECLRLANRELLVGRETPR